MRSGIYAITNLYTGHVYVGQASNLSNRWACHKKDLRKCIHGNRYLQNAWNLYGETAFEFSVLEYCEKDKSVLCKREQKWMDFMLPEYNLAPSSESTLGVKYSEESKKKMSEARKGVPKPTPVTETHRANLKAACGTAENRERLRKLHLGKKKSAEQRAKMSAWQIGKPKSEETRRRISEALKRRAANAAHATT